MSADLETQLREALDARAATTTTTPDAWARINRRVDRHDHRRSVVLKTAAAAVIVLLVVGGGIALFRGGNDDATVATGGAASKAADSREGASSSPTPDVQLRRDADGTVSAEVVDGPRISTGVSPVQAILTARTGSTLVGLVPPQTQYLRINGDLGAGSVLLGTIEVSGDPAKTGARVFVYEVPASVTGTMSLTAVDSADQVVGSTTVDVEGR